MKITRESLEKSLELSAKATPGPWFTESYTDDKGEHRWTTIHDNKTGYGDDVIGDTNLGICSTDTDKIEEKENAEFIAHHSPTFITALVQAHIEAIGVIEFYKDGDLDGFGAKAFLSKHGGVE